MSIMDWIATTRIGRFVGLVVIVDTMLFPVYFLSPIMYLGVVIGNLGMSIYCALTMKVYK